VRLGWERRVGGGCDGCGEELVAGGSEGKVGGSSLPSRLFVIVEVVQWVWEIVRLCKGWLGVDGFHMQIVG